MRAKIDVFGMADLRTEQSGDQAVAVQLDICPNEQMTSSDLGAKTSKIYIFRPRYERAFLILLSILLALAGAACGGLLELPTIKDEWVKFVVFFLFFNYLHTLLTILGIILVPELRAWFKSQFQPRRFVFFGSIIAVIGYVSWWGVRSFNKNEASGVLLAGIFTLLISIHNLGQTKGLSLMYNRYLRPLLSDAEKVQQTKVERSERWIFNILISLLFLLALGTSYKVLKTSVPQSSILYLQFLFVGLAGALILNSLRYPQLFKTNKFFYLQVIWLFALIPVVPAALVLQMGVHGVEYVLLGDVVVRRSKLRLTKKLIVFAGAFLLCFAVIKGLDSRLFSQSRGAIDSWYLPAIIIVGVFIEYFHYYVDGIMFRFKDQAVRSNIAPLFSKGETA